MNYNLLIFVLMLMIISITDIKFFIIPNIFVILLLIPGIIELFYLFSKMLLLGGIFGLIIFLILYLLFPKGIGLGDVKLAGAIGLFLGLKLTILAILLSFLSGAIVGLLLIALHKKSMKDPIPFGPFLAFGAITSLFFGEYIINWYMNLFL